MHGHMNLNLGIQLANGMRHIVICGLPGSSVFFHSLIKGTISEKKNFLKIKCVF